MYSPTFEAHGSEVVQLYNDLSEDIHTVGQGQFPIIMGYFNAILTIKSGHAKFSSSFFPNRDSVHFEKVLKEGN